MAGGTAGLADVLAPDNEEGTKATILKWCKAAGDMLLKDEPLLELETDKVTVEIPSPATGQLAEILKQPNEEVLPGQLLARIRIDAESGPGSEAAGANGAPRMEQTAGDGAEPRAQAPGVMALAIEIRTYSGLVPATGPAPVGGETWLNMPACLSPCLAAGLEDGGHDPLGRDA